MAWHYLDGIEDSRLDVYREIKNTNLTRWSGRFIAEGRRVVTRLLQSGFDVESVLIGEHRVEEYRPLIGPEVEVFVLPVSEAARLVGYNFHSGVLACGLRRSAAPLESILPSQSDRLTLAVLPNVNDPENLGSIIRLAAGFGLDAVLVGPSAGDPFSRRALRVSMATALTIPVIRCEHLEQDLLHLRDSLGFQIVATVLDEGAESLEQVGRTGRAALMFGSEGHGLGEPWTTLADRLVTIPMGHGTDSLNVAMASAVVFYHFQQVGTKTCRQ